MMHDLKKLEEKFHEFLKDGLNEKEFDINGIEITEGSFSHTLRILILFFSHWRWEADIVCPCIDKNGYWLNLLCRWSRI